MCSFRLSSLPAPRLAADAPLTFFCWPSSFQRTPANSPRFLAPRSSRLRVQKYHIFPYLQQLFSLFFNLFTFYLNIREINFTLFAKAIARRRFSCGKRGFRGPPRGRYAPSSARFRRKSARPSRPQCRCAEARDRPDIELPGGTLYIYYVRTGCMPDVPDGCARGVHGHRGSVLRRIGLHQFCKFCEKQKKAPQHKPRDSPSK